MLYGSVSSIDELFALNLFVFWNMDILKNIEKTWLFWYFCWITWLFKKYEKYILLKIMKSSLFRNIHKIENFQLEKDEVSSLPSLP